MVDNPYIDYTYDLLKKSGGVKSYEGYGKEQASYDQRKNMSFLPSGKIICPKNVSQRFIQINQITEIEGKEVPFFVFAHDGRSEGNENLVVIDEIVFSEEDLNKECEQACYGSKIVEYLNKKIRENRNNPSFIVIQGHSHPSFRGDVSNMLSVQDLANVIYLNKQTGVQFGACVITPDKKINMCFYDPIINNFFKVEKFKITEDKKDAVKVLPSPITKR